MKHGNIGTITSRVVAVGTGCLLPTVLFLAPGCADLTASTQPSMSEQQERAIGDPMDYSVNWKNPDISGGGFSDFHKNSFDRDVNDVFNP